MSDIAAVVLAVASLLAVISLLVPLGKRLGLPTSVCLAAVGCALGGTAAAFGQRDGLGVVGDLLRTLDGLQVSGDALLYIFLPALLFETALAIDVRQLMDDVWPVLLLAVVAVLVSTAVVGLAVWAASGVALAACLLLAAIASTTDPVAVVALFRDLGVPRRLSLLVEGESLFNDAAAIALSALLLAIITGHGDGSLAAAALAFGISFLGGLALGYAAGRLAALALERMGGLRKSTVTLTIALAYLVYVAGDHYLGVSGVVAVVTAALTVGLHAPTRIAQSVWANLTETWSQIAFWASSLIVLLATMMAPGQLSGLTAAEAALLAVLFLAALAARALVLFGLMPLLSAVGLAQQVERRLLAVMLWGGLRGAVSLALGLAVMRNPDLPPEVRRLVAVLVTAFVLATLFVQATTLRPLIRWLHLDRLTGAELALRNRVIQLALRSVGERMRALAADGAARLEAQVEALVARRMAVLEGIGPEDGMCEADFVQSALVMVTQYEQTVYLRYFDTGVITGTVVRLLVAKTTVLQDSLKEGGVAGYEQTASRGLARSPDIRLALALHRRLGLGRWLAGLIADRYESLLVTRGALGEVAAFVDATVRPLFGAGVGDVVGRIVGDRRRRTEAALAKLPAQFPEFAELVQGRLLELAALRIEAAEYDSLIQQRVIAAEVHKDLERELRRHRRQIQARPVLDLGLDRAQLVRRVPMFEGLAEKRLRELSRLLRPRLAVPGEIIVRRGDAGDAMYFIVAGTLDAVVAPGITRTMGPGDFFGEIALLNRSPRTADVTATGFCQLLVLAAADFDRLVGRQPGLRDQVRLVAQQRLGRTAEAEGS